MKYLCEIRYLGTHFCGFQVQPSRRTVQGVLTEAASKVFGCPVAVTGASRTDSGVHAAGFALTLEPKDGALRIPPDNLPLALREHLPPDLSLSSARIVADGFHPRYDARWKEYRYTVYASRVADPFLYGRVWHMPIPFLPDAVERMNAAAAHLVGTHDFSAFRSEGSPTRSPIRTVFGCTVERDGALYTISIRGDGFLYNMVRIVAGTLVSVAVGQIEPDRVGEILSSRKRPSAGPTAPPEGLTLWHVHYDEADFLKETREEKEIISENSSNIAE